MAKLLFALWLCVFLVETFSASIKTRGKPSLVHVHVLSVEHSFESWGSLNSNFLQVNCPCPSSYEPTNIRGAYFTSGSVIPFYTVYVLAVVCGTHASAVLYLSNNHERFKFLYSLNFYLDLPTNFTFSATQYYGESIH